MGQFSFDREKLKDVVNFIVKSSDPKDLGQTKLHKVLYFSEMLSYLNRGSPICGAKYKKRPHGPTCDALLSVVPEMQREGRLRVYTEDYFGYQKKVFQDSNRLNNCSLDDEERAILTEVTEWVCRNNSAKSISEFSHNIVWEMVEFGEDIPYHLAIHLVPTDVSEEALAVGEQLWAQCENETAGRATELEGSVAASIRGRLH